jgi:hypothetical protein
VITSPVSAKIGFDPKTTVCTIDVEVAGGPDPDFETCVVVLVAAMEIVGREHGKALTETVQHAMEIARRADEAWGDVQAQAH